MSFEGTRDAQPDSWSTVYTLLHTADPAASMLTIETNGNAPPDSQQVIAEAAGATYETGADGGCSGLPIDPDDSMIAWRDPSGLLPSMIGAEDAGADDANGVAATHYTFDERALGESGRTDTSGETWVAVTGGYVVKYLQHTTAHAEYFGEGRDGAMTLDYELTEINQALEIVLPAGCQVDAPVMPGATGLLVLPRSMGFDTASTVADGMAFYRQQLPGRG